MKCCYADAMKLMLLMRQEKRLTYIEAPASLYIRENRTFSLSHATIAKERSHHSSSSNLLPRANIPSISALVASHLTLQCCAGMLVPSDQANYFQCEACQKLATLRRKQKKKVPWLTVADGNKAIRRVGCASPRNRNKPQPAIQQTNKQHQPRAPEAGVSVGLLQHVACPTIHVLFFNWAQPQPYSALES